MKKINRSNAPTCLTRYGAANLWSELCSNDRAIIWQQLDQMQNGFCAYCECKLKKKHIEHFRTRKNYRHLTFTWFNLFGSCDYKTRCGHFKDSNKTFPYSPDEIIKPDSDDPEEYLRFLTNGMVRPIEDIDAVKKRKAQETIRVFNLIGDPSLVNSRRSALKNELKNILALYDLIDSISFDDFKELLSDELSTVEDREYRTALEHAWKFNESY
ncbi:retron Ec78 anti-phage system effector HNH endonuclease PtuB [Alkalimonas collagenimarina]|uniref:Retron Ec78 anti-phage system effector HNH endonuclease PtuB n=1 Tax=Alkalimonas collagenimarina TaxID=400390 RepID=A0ABT9H0Z4_9GAMM|nr:retron Ec78 anti-phage system effector HNH endonuclease PtuB [Alkalimonas collagenimarina]MDP4536991.1 retron Ec78 anti-phage system effector HNH endonuclease PtuB [Alkalimonas collagenimarina]